MRVRLLHARQQTVSTMLRMATLRPGCGSVENEADTMLHRELRNKDWKRMHSRFHFHHGSTYNIKQNAFHKIQKLEVGESYVTGEAQIARAAYVAGAAQVVGAANVTAANKSSRCCIGHWRGDGLHDW